MLPRCGYKWLGAPYNHQDGLCTEFHLKADLLLRSDQGKLAERGWLNTVDLLIKVSYFVKNYVIDIKAADAN